MKNCPDDYISRWFSVLHRISISYILRELKEYNIGNGQIMFLLELYYHDGINQGELSSYLNIDGANTTRAIKKLEQEGYVKRIPDESDGRAYKIYLTDKAHEIKDRLFERMRNWDNRLLATLTPEEKQTFSQLLKKVGHSVSENERCENCPGMKRCEQE